MDLMPSAPKRKSVLVILLQLIILLFLMIIMIVYPQNIFPAARQGIEIWWQIVFPGLFPFFILSELMIQFGVVQFLSIFLEPVMRPLFNVPGASALVLAAGYTSGAPIGGILTATLHQDGLINEEEAGRLIAFTNNASPLFMLSSIAIGFLGQASLGWILASSHYLANICVGILLKYISPHKNVPTVNYTLKSLFLQGLRKMEQAQGIHAKPLGSILGDAVKKSMQNILVIGGFIILFSVLIEILLLMGLVAIMGKLAGIVLLPLGFSAELLIPLASGVMEMTTGIKLIAESNAPLLQQLVCISMLLGWAGIAIHAQVIAFVSSRRIRLMPYFLARCLQGSLAAVFTFILGYHLIPVFNLKAAPLRYPLWGPALHNLRLMLLIIICLAILSSLVTVAKNLGHRLK